MADFAEVVRRISLGYPLKAWDVRFEATHRVYASAVEFRIVSSAPHRDSGADGGGTAFRFRVAYRTVMAMSDNELVRVLRDYLRLSP